MEYWMVLAGFFSKLEPKDWVTLIVSAFALVVSIASFCQKTRETRLALRKQLTDLLEKLTDLNVEFGKFRASKENYPSNYPGLLNDQRRFLVRQAAFIVTRIKDLVSPFEYILLAGGFDEISDDVQATRFFELAVSSAGDTVERGIAVRGYGRYLFSHGRLDEARGQYAKAIGAFAGDFDRSRYYRADTYERWAALEREWRFPTEADALIERAIKEYEGFGNPTRRDQEISRLRGLLGHPVGSADSPHPTGNVKQ